MENSDFSDDRWSSWALALVWQASLWLNQCFNCIWEKISYKLVISGVRDYWVYLSAVTEFNAVSDYLWTASDSLGSLVRIHAVARVQYDDDRIA